MRLGIASKFTLTIFLSTCAFVLPWHIRLIFAFIVLIIARLIPAFRPVSDDSYRAFQRLLTYLVTLAFLIVVLNGLLLGDGESSHAILGVKFHDKGILFGITVSSRLILLALSIMLFFVSTSLRDLSSFLAALRLPSSLVSILVLSAYFLAELPERINQIFWAQEARGAPVRANIFLRAKSLTTVLRPLVLSSIVESVERGISLELRGFQGSIGSKKPIDHPDKQLAALFLLLTFGLILASYLWK